MTFRQSRKWLLLILLLLLLLIMVFEWPYAILLFPITLYLFVLIRGAIYIQNNFFLNAINHLPNSTIEGQNAICLTFDDGIHPVNTLLVLDILKQENVKAMFFVIGKNIAGHEFILQRMAAEGHIIGNHSHSHSFWFDLLSKQAMIDDLKQMNQSVVAVLGQNCLPVYFRPPYGVTNPNLAAAIQQTAMHSVGWSFRSHDTVAKDKEGLLRKLKSGTQPGIIVLLHDRCDITVAALTDYIAFCKAQGYTFTTLP